MFSNPCTHQHMLISLVKIPTAKRRKWLQLRRKQTSAPAKPYNPSMIMTAQNQIRTPVKISISILWTMCQQNIQRIPPPAPRSAPELLLYEASEKMASYNKSKEFPAREQPHGFSHPQFTGHHYATYELLLFSIPSHIPDNPLPFHSLRDYFCTPYTHDFPAHNKSDTAGQAVSKEMPPFP